MSNVSDRPSYSHPDFYALPRHSHLHPMTSTPASPTRPSPNDLQTHLYASFLQRKTADVALRVRGSWTAVYRLHRVILIQAGFFQSLFTSGFSESTSKSYRLHDHTECIDIVFDDPNITRAAFEICVARLYGGGPPLWISPSLIPTPTHPLTPSFTSTISEYPSSQLPGLLPPGLDISTAPAPPPGYQPATPRFLLSLLSTALYLSVPSVASQALSAIVRTVGPHTAVRYLDFALGRGIGPTSNVDLPGHNGGDFESAPAVGLEDVAEIPEEVDLSSSLGSIKLPENLHTEPTSNSKHQGAKHSRNCSGPPSSDSDSDAEDLRASAGSSSTWHSARGKYRSVSGASSRCSATTRQDEPCFYYGAISDKVGETAACWLTRWGVDMLELEESEVAAEGKNADAIWSPSVSQRIQHAVERPGSAPPDMAGSRSRKNITSGKPQHVPTIWRKGGLDARWVRGILSSDALFVKGEKERYDMARRVVEVRRTSSADCFDDEAEFEELFNSGIYYANMHMDDLIAISKDVSPTTGKPFVSLGLLQAALWNQSTLSQRITSRPSGSSPSLSPTDRTKALDIGVLASEVGQSAHDPEEWYYPIPKDSSLRLGDSTGLEGASMDQLFDMGSSRTEANFFGLQPVRQTAATLSASSSPAPPFSGSPSDSQTRWTTHPPFRFAVEFWDVDALKEKSRLHSHTVWYAGSLYNVYVQIVRKKGIQLGIYLHRQSVVDPIPPSSAPITAAAPSAPREAILGRAPSSSVSSPRSPLAASLSTASSLSRNQSPTHPTPGTPAAERTPMSAHAHPTSLGGSTVMLPATAPPAAPVQPYRDPRPAVSAYFTIACASATGASLTRFTSAPDTFAVSQSWGWKSSSLRTEEYLEVDAEGQPVSVVMPAGKEVSLRATVVLGVV